MEEINDSQVDHGARKGVFDEFMVFIRKQGVIGLAIGFILGGSVSGVVSSFVADIINPLVGYVFGSKSGLMSLRIGQVAYGSFLTAVIDFLIMAAVVFFLFKKLRLDRLDAEKK